MEQSFPTIKKPSLDQVKVKPNLLEYEKLRSNFNWNDTYKELEWLPGGNLNNAYEAIDRHAKGPLKDKVAMIWEGKNGEREDYTFGQLKTLTDKFGNVLKGLGVQKGDRVMVFMDRIPEIYIAFFGALKIGAVVGPLFSAFGPLPVKDRMEDAGTVVLITQPYLRQRIAEVIPQLPALKHVIVTTRKGRDMAPPLQPGDVSYEDEMAKASTDFHITSTSQFDYSIIHYTSGTTGKPKGAIHRHQAVLQQKMTGKWCLDLHQDDIYWCTADPGWVTGTSYGMLAPWTNGVTQLIDESPFRPSRWYELLEKHKVTVWYTAPTAIRMLMKAGEDLPKKYNFSNLRFMASVGEPLNPEAVVWGVEVFGRPFHDNWWQTETGAIICANYAVMDIKPGSMGRPIPGVEVGIVDEDFNELPAGKDGNLAVRPGWPSMFHTYWNNQPMYNQKFKKGWYITGDRARKDKDGYIWFQGRSDDVIKTSGHLIGPFEVESCLIEHPAVAEAGVIGKPDPIAMEIVKAFVSLKDGYDPSNKLKAELIRFSRERLSAAVAPREIEFVPSLPKTRSGKIMRRLLKARELGLPEGDTSTLED